jgi:hypothetical protein
MFRTVRWLRVAYCLTLAAVVLLLSRPTSSRAQFRFFMPSPGGLFPMAVQNVQGGAHPIQVMGMTGMGGFGGFGGGMMGMGGMNMMGGMMGMRGGMMGMPGMGGFGGGGFAGKGFGFNGDKGL